MTDKNLISEPFNYAKMIDYQEGAIVSRTIIEKDTGTVTLFAFDAGQKLSTHSTPYEGLVQIVEGTGVIIINGKKFILDAPSSIIMPADKPHSVEAEERFKMVLIMIKAKN
ncbi:MAG: cupin domain-containing protein [Bacteroidales bacterium]|nr:cupin domain-containing protein [Bacteroidales bacterium]